MSARPSWYNAPYNARGTKIPSIDTCMRAYETLQELVHLTFPLGISRSAVPNFTNFDVHFQKRTRSEKRGACMIARIVKCIKSDM